MSRLHFLEQKKSNKSHGRQFLRNGVLTWLSHGSYGVFVAIAGAYWKVLGVKKNFCYFSSLITFFLLHS